MRTSILSTTATVPCHASPRGIAPSFGRKTHLWPVFALAALAGANASAQTTFTGTGSWDSPSHWSNGIPNASKAAKIQGFATALGLNIAASGINVEFGGNRLELRGTQAVVNFGVTLGGLGTNSMIVRDGSHLQANYLEISNLSEFYLFYGASMNFTDYVRINDGSLTIGAGVDPSAPGPLQAKVIINAARLNFNTNFPYTLNTPVTGAGGIYQAGTGTTYLFNTNPAYTPSQLTNGGAFVTGGQLVTNLQSMHPSNPVSVSSGATFTFRQETEAIYQGHVSGAGALTKEGAGEVWLQQATSHTGGTFVDAGTLRGNHASLRGAITNHASLIFHQTSDGTFNGTIAGGGTLTKDGPATLILPGSHTSYTPAITVKDGNLQGTAQSLPRRIFDDRTVTFDQASNDTYPGWISGTGAVLKKGAGNLTFNSVHTYTGGTIVNQGKLTLNGFAPEGAGIIHGDLTIGSGASVLAEIPNAFGYLPGIKLNTVTINGGDLLSTAPSDQGWGIQYTLAGAKMFSNATQPLSTINDPLTPSNFAFGGNTSVTVKGLVGQTLSESFIYGRVDLRGDGGVTNVNFDVQSSSMLHVPAAITNTNGSVGLTKTGIGPMTLSGPNSYLGGTTVNNGTLYLQGPVSGGVGRIRGALTIHQDGIVYLNTANALGTTAGARVTSVTIDRGHLINQVGEQGWDIAYTLKGGNMISSGGDPVNASVKFVFAGNTSVTVDRAEISTIDGRIDFRGGGGVNNFNFTVSDANGRLKIPGAITNSNDPVGLTKLGPGTMEISGQANHQGPTHINGGTFLVTGTGSMNGNEGVTGDVNVAAGATLVAEGAVGGDVFIQGTLTGSGSTGAATILNGGVLAPGNTPGTLEVSGLTMQAGAKLEIELGRTTPGFPHDIVVSEGPISLSGNLDLINLGGSFSIGSTFHILRSDDLIAGMFDNVTPTSATTGTFFDAGQLFLVNYADHHPNYDNAVSLTVIPEPGSALLLVLGATALASRRRREAGGTKRC